MVIRNRRKHDEAIQELEVFEIYAKLADIIAFNAFRHMLIEDRILILLGKDFHENIVILKNSGLKIEPSFAKLLGEFNFEVYRSFHWLKWSNLALRIYSK